MSALSRLSGESGEGRREPCPALTTHLTAPPCSRGAINAYSRAIELDDAIPLVWSNRAACHLALGCHASAVGDCTRALQLLTERKSRCGVVAAKGGGRRECFQPRGGLRWGLRVQNTRKHERWWHQCAMHLAACTPCWPPTALCEEVRGSQPGHPTLPHACRFESGAMEAADAAAYRRQLLRALVRRGQAQAELGMLAHALEDYEQAMRWAGVWAGVWAWAWQSLDPCPLLSVFCHVAWKVVRVTSLEP